MTTTRPTTPVNEAALRFVDRPHRLPIGSDLVTTAASLPTLNPATGAVLAEVPVAGPSEVAGAVEAADRAFAAWRQSPPSSRARLLWRLAELVDHHAEELAAIDVLDNGKPLAEATAVDVVLTADIFRYYASCAATTEGAVLPVSASGLLALGVKEPVGVVAAVTPWNFPLLEVAYKLGPALAAACTIVLKPSELAPLSTLRLAELVAEAGFPPGVVNVVVGGPDVGEALFRHPLVRKVAFTGQRSTGRAVLHAAADDLKPVTLELGGKSPNIVFADADPVAAAAGAFGGIFFNQGEACVAGSRLLVEAPVADRMVEALAGRARTIHLGDGFDPATTMGPMISATHRRRVLGFVERAVAEGASVAVGGGAGTVDGLPEGYFVEPTVLTEVHGDMEVAQEEVFGPVLSVIPWSDPDELLALAEDVPYGIAAGIWSGDTNRALRLARQLEVGTVWVNTYGMFDAAVPFGGRKQSGFGRSLGKEALDPYLVSKSIWVDTETVPLSDGQSVAGSDGGD